MKKKAKWAHRYGSRQYSYKKELIFWLLGEYVTLAIRIQFFPFFERLRKDPASSSPTPSPPSLNEEKDNIIFDERSLRNAKEKP